AGGQTAGGIDAIVALQAAAVTAGVAAPLRQRAAAADRAAGSLVGEAAAAAGGAEGVEVAAGRARQPRQAAQLAAVADVHALAGVLDHQVVEHARAQVGRAAGNRV